MAGGYSNTGVIPSPKLRKAHEGDGLPRGTWICRLPSTAFDGCAVRGTGMTFEHAYIRWLESYARVHLIPRYAVNLIVLAVSNALGERMRRRTDDAR